MEPELALDYISLAVWGMLYVDDACIALQSSQGVAKMMEVIVEVCRAFALTMSSAKKTETMCVPPPRTPRTMVRVEAAGQIYKYVQSNGKSLWWGGSYTGEMVLCSGLVEAGRDHRRYMEPCFYYCLSVPHIMGILS